MSRNKEFTAPVYLIVPLVLIQAIALCFLLYMASFSLEREKAYERDILANNPTFLMPHESKAFIAQSIHAAVVILILIGEAIVCWRIRNKNYNRWLITGYWLPLAFALGLLPVVAFQEGLWSDLLVPAPMMYWTAILLSQLFFIQLIRQARRKSTASKRPTKGKESADGDWVEELHDLID